MVNRKRIRITGRVSARVWGVCVRARVHVCARECLCVCVCAYYVPPSTGLFKILKKRTTKLTK